MHPHTFYSTLFDPEKGNEVFVVMSFAPEFNNCWLQIIKPAVESRGLIANRVDYRTSGDSIVQDIIDGIAHSQLVLADISSSPMADRNRVIWPQRNANVMWEVGIAHTMRTPDEVLLVRTDHDDSIFDLTQFRVFNYDPRDVRGSRKFLEDRIDDRIKLLEKTQDVLVKRCLDLLDPHSLEFFLFKCGWSKPFEIPSAASVNSVSRLFELGLLRTSKLDICPSKNPNQVELRTLAEVTPFGNKVRAYTFSQMRMTEEAKKAIQERQNAGGQSPQS